MNIKAAIDKLSRLWEFSRLDRRQREYLRWIKDNRTLDRQHYRSVHQRLSPIFRALPERHYVTFGERAGLSPTPDFVPSSYLRWNPDLPRAAFRQPFRHYIELGRKRGLEATDRPTATDYPVNHRAHRSINPIAVVVHVYFLELWPELAHSIRSIDVDADVIVTITEAGGRSSDLQDQISREFPEATVAILPNKGRDILPFCWLLSHGFLDNYEAICKIHTKKSDHRIDGNDWRRQLLADLLPGPNTEALLHRFATSPAQILTSPAGLRSDRDSWGHNRSNVAQLLPPNMCAGKQPAPFPAGSMFWTKAPVLAWLKRLKLTDADFEFELGQLDGTTAHAIERLFGFAALACDGEVLTIRDIDALV